MSIIIIGGIEAHSVNVSVLMEFNKQMLILLVATVITLM